MTGNARTYVLIEDGTRGGLRMKLQSWPRGDAGRGRRFRVPSLPDFDVPQAEAIELAREYGGALLRALRKEKSLKTAIEDALRADDDEVRPLCFKVEGTAAEALGLRWEALWEESQQFLALNEKWPIGRVVESRQPVRQTFEPPLRVLAVMSGARLEARAEWAALQRAIQRARANALEVHATVVVGEQDLFNELSAEAAKPGGNRWLEVMAMEGAETIEHLKRRPFPHIVHFFCHGSVGVGEGGLQFATIGDWAEEEDNRTDSVLISLAQLRSFVTSRLPWLVTLNCCEGGRIEGSTESLASSVVAAGAGAALGWRRTIPPRYANILTAAVYDRLLGDLAEKLVGAERGTTVELELTSAAYVARDQLRNSDQINPLDASRWTLPVLFVRQEPLSVVVLDTAPDDETDLGVSRVDRDEGESISAVTREAVLHEAVALLPQLAPALNELFAALAAGGAANAADDESR